MGKKQETILRLCRVWVMFAVALSGIAAWITYPVQGGELLGSSLIISVGYLCVLFSPRGQIFEFLLLICSILATMCFYISPNMLNGVLCLPQWGYFFYCMGRVLLRQAGLTARKGIKVR